MEHIWQLLITISGFLIGTILLRWFDRRRSVKNRRWKIDGLREKIVINRHKAISTLIPKLQYSHCLQVQQDIREFLQSDSHCLTDRERNELDIFHGKNINWQFDGEIEVRMNKYFQELESFEWLGLKPYTEN